MSLNIKIYCSERHIAINPPQSNTPCFKYICLIFLATLGISPGSPLLWVSSRDMIKNMLAVAVECYQTKNQPSINICMSPHSPNLAPCNFWLFPKSKWPQKVNILSRFRTLRLLQQYKKDIHIRGLLGLFQKVLRCMG